MRKEALVSDVPGGHVARCDKCDHVTIAYSSCRNRHCPKCQGQIARAWLEQRQADLLPVAYYHVEFTLPAPVAAIAFGNKAVVYDLLFRTAADTLLTIAADPNDLGAWIGLTAVLHTWGSAMTHHPHVHIVVPGGDLSPDGSRSARVLTAREGAVAAVPQAVPRPAGRGASRRPARLPWCLAPLADPAAFAAQLVPLRRAEWVVYAKRPFAGPEAVLAYLSRYTHRVAISNSRLVALNEHGVTFRRKDYRARGKGVPWQKTMTLAIDEFIRRFLLHVLPNGPHRIRHDGLFASGSTRAIDIVRVRRLFALAPPEDLAPAATTSTDAACPALRPSPHHP